MQVERGTHSWKNRELDGVGDCGTNNPHGVRSAGQEAGRHSVRVGGVGDVMTGTGNACGARVSMMEANESMWRAGRAGI